jgi:hypothetical protein
MNKLVIISIVFITFFGKQVFSQNQTDSLKIIETSENYIKGWYAGDTVRMDKALHPDLVKRRADIFPYTGNSFMESISKSAMMEYTKAGFGKSTPIENQNDEIEVLDIFGNIASVKITSIEFIDYLQLVKWNGEWKIINVLWDLNKK